MSRDKFLSRRNVHKFMLSTGNKMASVLRYMASKENWTVDEESSIKKKCNTLSFDVNYLDTDKSLMLSYCLSAPRAVSLLHDKANSEKDFMEEFERRMLYLGDDEAKGDAVRVARSRMIFLGRMNMLAKVFEEDRRKDIIEAVKKRNEEEED